MYSHARWTFASLPFTTIVIITVALLSLCSQTSAYRSGISKRRIQSEEIPLASGPAAFIIPGGSQLSHKPPYALLARPQTPSFNDLLKRADGRIDQTRGQNSVTDEECQAQGLEKCGSTCVAHCCNKTTALACPASAYCTANEEYEFCCENGHKCDSPANCLSYSDTQCENKPGETIIDSNGETRNCCYEGFESCSTTLAGLPVCVPTGVNFTPSVTVKRTTVSAIKSTLSPTTTNSAAPTLNLNGTQSTSVAHPTSVGNDKALVINTPAINNTSAANTSTNNGDDDGNAASQMAVIIGAVVGGTLGLIMIVVSFVLIGNHYRKRQARERDDFLEANTSCSEITNDSYSSYKFYCEEAEPFSTKMSGAIIGSAAASDSASTYHGKGTPADSRTCSPPLSAAKREKRTEEERRHQNGIVRSPATQFSDYTTSGSPTALPSGMITPMSSQLRPKTPEPCFIPLDKI